MKITNKLGHYLALTLGAGAAATSAEGATTVTVYGSGVTPHAGINPSVTSYNPGYMVLDYDGGPNGSFFRPLRVPFSAVALTSAVIPVGALDTFSHLEIPTVTARRAEMPTTSISR